MHLDSIFDGFQKLISGSDESREQRQLPFVIEKTIHNILFIKTHMQRQDEFDAVSKSTIILLVSLLSFPFYHLYKSLLPISGQKPPSIEFRCPAVSVALLQWSQ